MKLKSKFILCFLFFAFFFIFTNKVNAYEKSFYDRQSNETYTFDIPAYPEDISSRNFIVVYKPLGDYPYRT